MTVGAEPKKLAALALLVVAAGVIVYQQFFSEPGAPAAAAPARSQQPSGASRGIAEEILDGRSTPKPKAQRTGNDFKPSLKPSKPGEGPDPVKLDPTLRVDLLAKVRGVEYQTVDRNLFQFAAPKPKVAPQQAEAVKPAPPPKPISNDPAAPPPKAPPPPITLKYFGYANRPGDARRRALLMDGEEIFIAVEGQLIKKRYKVVRIGVNSIVMEDMEFQSQQTLPLQEG